MSKSKQAQRRDKLGLIASKKLEAAGNALHEYRMACIECDDFAAQHDRRKSLVAELLETSAWVEHACKAGGTK